MTTACISPTAAARAWLIRLELPQEIRIRLVRQHLRNKFRTGPQIPTLLKHLRALDIDLAPARLNQPANARAVHILLEARPSYRASTHRATLSVRVQGEIFPCRRSFRRGELVRPIGIGEDVGAVTDGDHFAVQGRVARYGVLVHAGADQFAEATVGGVVDDGGAEGCEGTGGAGGFERVVGGAHPVCAC